MLSGIVNVKTHRSWYVSDFQVWGTPGWGELDLLMIEKVDSVLSVLFNRVSIGDNAQEVNYKDLTDFRGNTLPEKIKNPKILVKARSEQTAFIVGDETEETFKVARDADFSGSVKVDLFIIEMGD